jgi:hypothetical protein
MIQVEVISKTAPAVGLEHKGIMTTKVHVPLYIWTELLTHKRFARNAASNRAMTTEKKVALGYFEPIEFVSQAKGMKSGDPVDLMKQEAAQLVWDAVWDYCATAAQILTTLGVAKEQANRVLPTFQTVSAVITGTVSAFEAMLVLRDNPQADVAMRTEFAPLIRQALRAPFSYGTQHRPFQLENDLAFTDHNQQLLLAARIARTSYGVPGAHDNDITLGTTLLVDGHMSPFEHSADWVFGPRASAVHTSFDAIGTPEFYGWENYRAKLESKDSNIP